MKLNKDYVPEKRDFPVLPAGTYDFEIENATHKKSEKTGNMYWDLMLRLDPKEGNPVKVFDTLTETESSEWKFHQLFDAIGVTLEDTDNMKDLIGEIGRVSVIVEKRADYPERNKVARYIAKEDKPKKPDSKPIPEDELPF